MIEATKSLEIVVILHLLRKEPMAGDVVSFVFDPPEKVTWQPGQYLKYTLPHDNPDDRGTERWFTIAAPPYEGNPRITTRISEKRSSFKSALLALKPGDAIEADAPEGDFVLGDQHDESVFIAGGIGFTPFHAILAELDHQGAMPKITILYGTRDKEPAYHAELEKLAVKYPQLDLHYIVQPQRINVDVIKQYVKDIKKPYFYVSGPEPMVETLDTMLQEMGVQKDKLRQDHFPGYTW